MGVKKCVKQPHNALAIKFSAIDVRISDVHKNYAKSPVGSPPGLRIAMRQMPVASRAKTHENNDSSPVFTRGATGIANRRTGGDSPRRKAALSGPRSGSSNFALANFDRDYDREKKITGHFALILWVLLEPGDLIAISATPTKSVYRRAPHPTILRPTPIISQPVSAILRPTVSI